MAKAWSMRLEANLPHNLWKEVVNCAAYLWNRTPRYGNGWKPPYELFHSYGGKTKKPQLAHLKAYGCRAYTMTANAQEKKNRLYKLQPRAYIGYLVGYDSSNIYRIWVPSRGKVYRTRDVTFDETRFYSPDEWDTDP